MLPFLDVTSEEEAQIAEHKKFLCNKCKEKRSTKWDDENLKVAHSLFVGINRQNIKIKDSLINLLVKVDPVQQKLFCQKGLYFFCEICPGETKNTAPLTSMLRNKGHIKNFLTRSQQTIRAVAQSRPLKTVTSMFNNCGFPEDGQAVADFLMWDIWYQGEGDNRALDRPLLRAFSSMFSGHRLPDKEAVDGYLAWDIWWQGEGDNRVLDRPLLQAFSSMFSGHKLPDKEAVDGYLAWDIWYQGEGENRVLDRPLLRAFSSMFHGHRLPDKEAVDGYLAWDIWWQGEGDNRVLDRPLLRAFSSMFNGHRLPDKEASDAVFSWLSPDGQLNRPLFRRMVRLSCGAYQGHSALGLPRPDTLKHYEQQLRLLFFPPGESDNSRDIPVKTVVLYLANEGGSRHLSWETCQAFHNVHNRLSRERPGAVSRSLDLLNILLRFHGGGEGVRSYLSVVQSDLPEGGLTFLHNALSRKVPLETIRYALTAIDRQDWQDYAYFTRDFVHCPDRERWSLIKNSLKCLEQKLPRLDLRKKYLDILQRFPLEQQDTFLQPENLAAVLENLPTLRIMERLAKLYDDKQLLAVFQACVDHTKNRLNNELSSFPVLDTLFQAKLRLKEPFYNHPDIPELALARTAMDDGQSVVIKINPESGVQHTSTLLQHLVVAVMDELSDTDYDFDGKKTLVIYPHGGDDKQSFPFPVPQLQEEGDGIRICNWNRADLERFYQAVEFPEALYKQPEDMSSRQPAYIRLRAERSLTTPQPGESSSGNLLSVRLLSGLLKNNVPLNQAGWRAAEAHRHRLPPPLLDKLREQVESARNENIPESLRTALLASYNAASPEEPSVGLVSEVVHEDAFPSGISGPDNVEDILKAAFSRDVLTMADLEALEKFRERLTLAQVVEIVCRIPASCPEQVVNSWTDLQREKSIHSLTRDPLFLECDDDTWNVLFSDEDFIAPMGQEWEADDITGLFTSDQL